MAKKAEHEQLGDQEGDQED